MKWLFLLVFCCFLSVKVIATTISDSLEISIVTIAPGKELYSTFGHSAIRVKDLKNNHDLIFNYGTFDFSTKGFYLKFLFGRLDYMLSIQNFEYLLEEAKTENRTLKEQVLNLSKEQKMFLISYLIDNYNDEKKRFYRYKFFTDNCATRIRDALNITYNNNDFISRYTVDSGLSYRQLYRPYLKNMPWILVGIEFLMGSMADKPAKENAMFLPDKLEQTITAFHAKTGEIILSETTYFIAESQHGLKNYLLPIYVAIFFLLVAIFFILRPTYSKYFDKTIFILWGVLGWFIFIVSFLSAHHELKNNYVILFVNPLYLFIPLIQAPKFNQIIRYILSITIGMGLILIPFLPQTFNIAIIIFSVACWFRLLSYYLILPNKNISTKKL